MCYRGWGGELLRLGVVEPTAKCHFGGFFRASNFADFLQGRETLAPNCRLLYIILVEYSIFLKYIISAPWEWNILRNYRLPLKASLTGVTKIWSLIRLFYLYSLQINFACPNRTDYTHWKKQKTCYSFLKCEAYHFANLHSSNIYLQAAYLSADG